MPVDARLLTLKWIGLNPDYEYKLYNDEDIDKFMMENLKIEKYTNMFNSYPMRIFKV